MQAVPEQKNKRSSRLRLAGRWFAFITAVALTWPRGAESWTSVLLPALSPHVGLASALAVRSVGLLTLLMLPVLGLALFKPRWFCRYLCPTGFLQERSERLRPAAAQRFGRVPEVGSWLVLLTFGGAGLGYPLFLWLDPLALFNGFLLAWRQPLTLTALMAGLGLPLLLLFNLLLPRVWCARICPLGATQDLLALPRRFVRQRFRNQSRENSKFPVLGFASSARRGFLNACLGAAGALFVMTPRGRAALPLRPPGALNESNFTGVCVRCGNCAQACPSRIIHPDLGSYGLASFLTPVLRFDEDYCRENCHRCNQVCPSAAIARLLLADKRKQIIGAARVDLDLCLLAEGKECTVCIRRCPFEAVAIQTSEDGFSTQPRVDLTKCNGCGACEAACPTRPRRAMRVTLRDA